MRSFMNQLNGSRLRRIELKGRPTTRAVTLAGYRLKLYSVTAQHDSGGDILSRVSSSAVDNYGAMCTRNSNDV